MTENIKVARKILMIIIEKRAIAGKILIQLMSSSKLGLK